MKKGLKRLFTGLAVVGLLAFSSVPTVVHADTTTTPAQGQTGGTQSSGIPGMPNPTFSGTTTSPGFDNGNAMQTIADKGKYAITFLVSIVGIILVGVGVYKGFRLASSNSKTRAEVIQDIVWWLVGGAVVFLAGVITSAVFAFTTSQ